MNAADWGVLLGGTALIALINWYFFFSSSEGAVAAVAASGIAEIPSITPEPAASSAGQWRVSSFCMPGRC